MTIVYFLISYSLLIVLSSFFCSWWYQLTRHSLEMQPNGKIKVIGYLPKWWSYFWEYQTGIKKIYYENEGEKQMIKMLPEKWNLIPLTELEAEMNCKIEKTETHIYFYIEEPKYRFPEWIRNPISACPTCMGSIYGTAIYLMFCLSVKDVFLWSNHIYTTFFSFWIIFIITLSFGNTFLTKYYRNYGL